MLKTISVIGSANCSDEEYQIARQVGQEAARRKAVVVCGGLGGIMEAASKGAKESGGLVVGILPGTESSCANSYIDIPIRTGLNEARNLVVASSGDAIIAIGGELGTLSEIAFGMKMKKLVIGIGTWPLSRDYCKKVNIVFVESAIEAVERAFQDII